LYAKSALNKRGTIKLNKDNINKKKIYLMRKLILLVIVLGAGSFFNDQELLAVKINCDSSKFW